MLGAFKLNSISKYIADLLPTLGAYGLSNVLDDPNAYSTSYNDQYGRSVDVCESYTIVGAATETDASGAGAGKAYIYNNTTGALLYTLNNPNAYSTSTTDYFGRSVAISNTHAIVGAWSEDDAGGVTSGKAYIFSTTTGSLLYTLDNPNPYGTSDNDQFGISVGISESYAIVGADREDDADVGGTGVDSGKAYIYDLTDGSLLYTLNNANSYSLTQDDYFGFSVDICESYAIVGAYSENPGGLNQSGSAYIYSTSTGALLYTLNNPNAYSTGDSDYFGHEVAITESYAIASAYQEDDAGGLSSGKAYIFSTTTGSLLYTLDNPNPYGTSVTDFFGYGVDICESYAIVGSMESDAGGVQSGKAYIYDLTDGSLVYTLDNPNAYGTTATDYFAYNNSVAITDSYAVVGAWNEDDAGGAGSGKAYLYNRIEASQITANQSGIVYIGSASSTATTITVPSTVLDGDLLVLFDYSSTTTDTTPSTWTSISKVTMTSVRTNISYKIATGSMAGTAVTGMAGTTRKVMAVFRNMAGTVSVSSISTPTAQATTVAPTNQSITGGTVPTIYFACYASSGTLATRGFTGFPTGITATEISSVSTSRIYAKFVIYDAGVNSNTPVNATISMPDGGLNSLQSFRMNLG